MKTIVLLFTSLLALNAFAERTGRDERVYRCVAKADAKNIGGNEVFDVHVVRGKEMVFTRQSDGKWFKAVTNGSGYYIYGYGGEGNLWTADTRDGYIGNVDESGKLVVAYSLSPGTYANNFLQCAQTRVISEYAPQTATELALQDLGENAAVANGGYEVRAYNPQTLDLDKDWRKLEEEGKGWEGCTWTRLTDRKAILKMVKEDASDPKAAAKIKALGRKPGIAQLIAYQSDDDISCSQRWVWLYTSDGFKLELYYSQGD